jgi:hypothetical protein
MHRADRDTRIDFAPTRVQCLAGPGRGQNREFERTGAHASACSRFAHKCRDFRTGQRGMVLDELALPVRMRAAIEALPYERPRLAVTAMVSRGDFAEMLERAIDRSGKAREVKLIEAGDLQAREAGDETQR